MKFMLLLVAVGMCVSLYGSPLSRREEDPCDDKTCGAYCLHRSWGYLCDGHCSKEPKLVGENYSGSGVCICQVEKDCPRLLMGAGEMAIDIGRNFIPEQDFMTKISIVDCKSMSYNPVPAFRTF